LGWTYKLYDRTAINKQEWKHVLQCSNAHFSNTDVNLLQIQACELNRTAYTSHEVAFLWVSLNIHHIETCKGKVR